jgi:hypothetical protein
MRVRVPPLAPLPMREPITCPDCGPYYAVETEVPFDDIMRVYCPHCSQGFHLWPCKTCDGKGLLEGIGGRETNCDDCKTCGGYLTRQIGYGETLLTSDKRRLWRQVQDLREKNLDAMKRYM